MKTTFLKITGSFLLLATITLFPSCKKETSDSGRSLTGTTYVRIVNAKEGTYPQDFYLNETKINVLPVSYGQNTGYFGTNGGLRTAHFNTSETQNLNVSAPVTFVSDRYYTAYLTGNGSIYATLDDMTLPAANTARVRFIILSTTSSQTLDAGYTGGAKFLTGITFQNISSYVNVNPSLGISLYAPGSTIAAISIPPSLQVGKIYTIYVTGNSNVTYKIVTQN